MPVRTHETPQTGRKKGDRKPVRRDPEKRRQQNIQAQRKYREKIRGRLERLEALESAAESSATQTSPVAGTNPPNVAIGQSKLTTTFPTISKGLPASNTSMSSSLVATIGSCPDITLSPDYALPELNVWDTTICRPDSEAFPSIFSEWDSATSSTTAWDSTSSTTSFWDPTTPIPPSLMTRRKGEYHDSSDPYWTITIDCGCPSLHFQLQTQGPDPFTIGEVRVLRWEPEASMVDPYANTLRIEAVCTMAALYHLAMHIGITEETLCADESLSPFFRFSEESLGKDSESNLIHTVQGIFKTLKPDLRPSREQITIKHHPYIDILPFPTLRNNLITQQGELDEDNLFQDMLTGLVCWGGAGIGKKDRNLSTGSASTGTPWDVRSWEAKTWFIEKYWNLLGGEDGELIRQSEWWRSLRGE